MVFVYALTEFVNAHGCDMLRQVQHMHLTDSAVADTATVELLVNTVHLLFPSFDYRYSISLLTLQVPRRFKLRNFAEINQFHIQP